MRNSSMIEALRSLEGYGYQIAYVLLQDEQLAVRAASQALKELCVDARFSRASPQERKALMKRSAVKQAIALKRQTFQAVRS